MAAILYVEDDFRVAMQVEETLAAAGHLVSIAGNVDLATELCTAYRFDLLIVDLYVVEFGTLAREGGFSLIKRLRGSRQPEERGWWRTVPILAVSGGLGAAFGIVTDADQALRNAVDAGATDAMKKGYTSEELRTRVNALLSGD